MTINIDMITPTTPVTFNEYYELLINHDWFYMFSDSSKVYFNGFNKESKLTSIANRHSFAKYMYKHFQEARNASITESRPFTIPQTLSNLKASYKESK